MFKLLVLTLVLPLLLAACAKQCATCYIDSNPYACQSCSPNNNNIYIWSCPNPSNQLTPFIVIAIIITLLHLFMLSMGLGIYRDLFQNIQLASLVTWRYGFQGGTLGLQGTNLAIVSRNSFPDTFGTQFIIVMIILGIFWLLLLLVDKISHSPTVTLIKRKKIIFPVRIVTFVFNILLYSSIMQIITVGTEAFSKIFALVLAILALVKILFVLIGLAVTSNWKHFQVDDPHYYVLLQQINTKKWYAKNNVLFSLLNRGCIIVVFLLFFKAPEIAGIVMILLQVSYTVFIIFLLRYSKIRYHIMIIAGNFLMFGLLFAVYIGSLSVIQSESWVQPSQAYICMVLILVGVFFFATISEIVLKKDIIIKQLKSIYRRFMICQSLQDQVLINKYDEGNHRQRVTQFRTNLLYHKDLTANNSIEMNNVNNTPEN